MWSWVEHHQKRVSYIIFKRLYAKQLDKTFNSQANIITDIAFHFNHLIDSAEGVW